jgi:hypothetical protein
MVWCRGGELYGVEEERGMMRFGEGGEKEENGDRNGQSDFRGT